MTLRATLALVVSLGFALLFARLGFWQLGRLHERRAFNALVASRIDSLPVRIEQLPADTGLARFRRVHVAGTYDYEHQVVLTTRSRNGSPGVYILTPLVRPGRDTAVMVYRGWVYSPDASRVDLAQWREPDTARVEGFVLPFPTTHPDVPSGLPSEPGALRWLDAGAVRRMVPYPIENYTVVVLGDSVRPPPYPARLEVPPLDEGPHKSYALQWFSFALIAIGGGAMLVLKERERG